MNEIKLDLTFNNMTQSTGTCAKTNICSPLDEINRYCTDLNRYNQNHLFYLPILCVALFFFLAPAFMKEDNKYIGMCFFVGRMFVIIYIVLVWFNWNPFR